MTLATLAAALILPAATVPVQYSIGHPQLTRRPPGMSTPASTLSASETQRLTAAINRLPSKKRKQLLKNLQSMSPAEREQFAQTVHRQFAAEDAAHTKKR